MIGSGSHVCHAKSACIVDSGRASAVTGVLERINELADQPEFYHLLSNSCTINIVSYAKVYRCWISRCRAAPQAGPGLDHGTSATPQ